MITLDCTIDDELKFTPAIPDGYHGPVIAGAQFLSITHHPGKIFIQRIKEAQYSLYYSLLHFTEKVAIKCKKVEQGLHARFILRSGQYNIYNNKPTTFKTAFKKNTDHRVLDIFYSHELLSEVNLVFWSMDEKNQAGSITPKTRSIKPSMQNIIREILYCPYEDSGSRFYFDIKLKEFLFVILADLFHLSGTRIKITAYEKSCIQKARDILLEDISRPPIAIPDLAKKSHINEYKLRKGFQQLYGMNMIDYLFEARMQKAQELLGSTDLPIKAICALVGYPRITHFITAFRRRFGYTPGSIRRRY